MTTTDGPRVLLETEAVRIVRRTFVNAQTREVLSEDVLEFPDGHDAMGTPRWKPLSTKTAGVSDLTRAVDILAKLVIAKQE